jgi:hypothetical protein
MSDIHIAFSSTAASDDVVFDGCLRQLPTSARTRASSLVTGAFCVPLDLPCTVHAMAGQRRFARLVLMQQRRDALLHHSIEMLHLRRASIAVGHRPPRSSSRWFRSLETTLQAARPCTIPAE